MSSCHLPSGRCGLKCLTGEHVVTADRSPPFGEVWIEIPKTAEHSASNASHLPSGRCGLKSQPGLGLSTVGSHLPSGRCGLKSATTTIIGICILSPPFGEVWIEIRAAPRPGHPRGHLPSGRCGLKYPRVRDRADRRPSPPFGEVWIEMDTCREAPAISGHLPSGRCGLKYAAFGFGFE